MGAPRGLEEIILSGEYMLRCGALAVPLLLEDRRDGRWRRRGGRWLAGGDGRGGLRCRGVHKRRSVCIPVSSAASRGFTRRRRREAVSRGETHGEWRRRVTALWNTTYYYYSPSGSGGDVPRFSNRWQFPEAAEGTRQPLGLLTSCLGCHSDPQFSGEEILSICFT